MPGVRYEDSSEALGEDFGTLIPQVGGQRRHWNSVSVDGLLGNEASGSNRMSSAINLDAIEEVKVLLNTYKAEFGRSGGANIQIVTKSGGADYRGSGYYYARRDAWNATRWENNRVGRREAGVSLRYLRRSTSADRWPSRALVAERQEAVLLLLGRGAAAGSGRRDRSAATACPTELERRGDFSQTRDQQGRPDFHPRSAAHRRVQHPHRRPGLLPRQHRPAESHRSPTALALLERLPAARIAPISNRPGTTTCARRRPIIRVSTTSCAPTGSRRRTRRFFSTLRTVLLEADRLGDHGRPARLGLVRRHLRVQRQLGQRRLEPRDRRATWSTSCRAAFGRRTEGFGVGAEIDWTRLRKVRRRLHARPVQSRAQPARADPARQLRRAADDRRRRRGHELSGSHRRHGASTTSPRSATR